MITIAQQLSDLLDSLRTGIAHAESLSDDLKVENDTLRAAIKSAGNMLRGASDDSIDRDQRMIRALDTLLKTGNVP